MKHLDNGIGLALSGGGFRATLFHLGVVRFLFEAEALKHVKLVSAVSGGSILAAHLILNWEKYTGTKEDFDSAAREILNFVQADVRGRVLRRWMLGCSTVVPRFLLPKKRRWTLVNLLQRQYAQYLFRVPVASPAGTRVATLRDLRSGRPAVRFNCTSLTTGDPCYFDQAGFGWYKNGVIEEPVPALTLQVAYAVAASSAFPPLFPPVEITSETLSSDRKIFDHEQRLTDGGVYDNLGIEALVAKYKGKSAHGISFETIIISDAEGNFDSDFDTKFSFPVNRNVRASDLLMKRVSTLQLEDFEASLKGIAEVTRVKIRESVRDLDDKTVLDPEAQRTLINVRTDLDCFTPNEVTALIAHGYSKARETLLDKELVRPDGPQFSWDPLGNWTEVKLIAAEEFQRSRLRKWRLWSLTDPISWVTGLYVVLICGALATPTYLLALARDTAQAQVVTAQAARNVAQQQVLSGAISQIQTLMTSISSSCPGGASGVPPVSWGSLQVRGNNAVNALQAAQVALAGGQRSDAVRQINSAEGEFSALVDGLRNSCSGGASGVNPFGYSAFTSSSAAVKGNLGELRRSLGG